jgi:hypothetical protein
MGDGGDTAASSSSRASEACRLAVPETTRLAPPRAAVAVVDVEAAAAAGVLAVGVREVAVPRIAAVFAAAATARLAPRDLIALPRFLPCAAGGGTGTKAWASPACPSRARAAGEAGRGGAAAEVEEAVISARRAAMRLEGGVAAAGGAVGLAPASIEVDACAGSTRPASASALLLPSIGTPAAASVGRIVGGCARAKAPGKSGVGSSSAPLAAACAIIAGGGGGSRGAAAWVSCAGAVRRGRLG